MDEWRRYQEETAKLFRELGCSVETDFSTQGARSKHLLDVSVRFTRFGLKQHWIVECKLWNRRVPKEKVLALKSITEDLGADRGILIAESGYQSGAHEAATLTNITLTTLAKLREAAKGELLALALPAVKRRAVAIRHDVHSLYDEVDLFDGVHQPEQSNNRGAYLKGAMHKPKPGTDSATLATIWHDAYAVEQGANDALLGSFPITLYIPVVDEKDNLLDDYLFDCDDLEEFVLSASDLLDTLEHVLLKQKVQVAKSAPA